MNQNINFVSIYIYGIRSIVRQLYSLTAIQSDSLIGNIYVDVRGIFKFNLFSLKFTD